MKEANHDIIGFGSQTGENAGYLLYRDGAD